MAIKIYRPTSPGSRFKTSVLKKKLTRKRPEKKLTTVLKKKAGRSRGKISVRHQGGGHKRLYRLIDFKRDKRDIEAEVLAIEYDPNRSSNIALLKYADGQKRYILAPATLRVGDKVEAGERAPIQIGNALPLRNMPTGSIVHNIELVPGKGGQLARAAGQQAVLMAKEGRFAQLRFMSGEIRLVEGGCYATIGQVGNAEHSLVKLGKAGRKRHLGIRPSVRGTAMPAGEHPHGGGEGRTGTGRPAKTLWGKPAKGKKTRKKNKASRKYILKKRGK